MPSPVEKAPSLSSSFLKELDSGDYTWSRGLLVSICTFGKIMHNVLAWNVEIELRSFRHTI
jgi:hypothetical protein